MPAWIDSYFVALQQCDGLGYFKTSDLSRRIVALSHASMWSDQREGSGSAMTFHPEESSGWSFLVRSVCRSRTEPSRYPPADMHADGVIKLMAQAAKYERGFKVTTNHVQAPDFTVTLHRPTPVLVLFHILRRIY